MDTLFPTIAQIATVIRIVLHAETPVTIRRIDLLTGYSHKLILGILTELQRAGDIELVEFNPRQTHWRLTKRWQTT